MLQTSDNETITFAGIIGMSEFYTHQSEINLFCLCSCCLFNLHRTNESHLRIFHKYEKKNKQII